MDQPTEIKMISNPEDRKKIMRMFDEISNSYARIEGERDMIKETIKDLSEKYEIPKKVLNKLSKIHHKQNFEQVVAENDEMTTFYENLKL